MDDPQKQHNKMGHLHRCPTPTAALWSLLREREISSTMLRCWHGVTTMLVVLGRTRGLSMGRGSKVRPSRDDVLRISQGRPAKKRGVGSRGVAHRLNREERRMFDLAMNHGYLETMGSAWRTERKGAPLVQTWRNWCDALAMPAVVVQRSTPNLVVIDLSPLRTNFSSIAHDLRGLGGSCDIDPHLLDDDDEAWLRDPIHQLPAYEISWSHNDRSAAKALAKHLIRDIFHFPVVKNYGTKVSMKGRPRAVAPDDDDDDDDGVG